LNERHAAYPNYGGRGITIHEDWRKTSRRFMRTWATHRPVYRLIASTTTAITNPVIGGGQPRQCNPSTGVDPGGVRGGGIDERRASFTAKGQSRERAIVHLLQQRGFAAERVPLSGAARGRFGGDVSVPLLGIDRRVEVKCRGNGFRQLYDWLNGADF